MVYLNRVTAGCGAKVAGGLGEAAEWAGGLVLKQQSGQVVACTWSARCHVPELPQPHPLPMVLPQPSWS